MALLDPLKVTARCWRGEHGQCRGQIYVFDDAADRARLAPCQCGCDCSRAVPITSPGAARTRPRQLAFRADGRQ